MKKRLSIVTLSMLMGAACPFQTMAANEDVASVAVVQQQKTVTGMVLDGMGEPIIGANVVVKGNPTLGSITDMDGKFSIAGVKVGDVLLVSYIGYNEQQVKVTAKNEYSITLSEDTEALDEVVVVGYGTAKKTSMTGSVSNVKAKNLEAIPSTNLSNSLAGRAAGATIVGNSGLMGASSEIRLRGGFNDPLFVIDGVVRDKEAFDGLEPHEIDQISFLKDAATASVYGSNASNGVVLVTTKGGHKNMKTQFNYQGSYTFATPTMTLFTDMFDAIDELEYQNAVARFKGIAEPNTPEEIAYFRDNNINYNVNDFIWQTPWNTKHSLSVQGGTDKVQYYVLGAFLAEEGSYKSLENHQYSLRSNISIDLSKYIKLGVNIAAKESNNRRFYWPFNESDDDQAVYDLYRCTFNTPRAVPFYLYEDGTPANEVTPYPVYPDFGSWQGWNVVDQVIGDRYIKTKRRDIQTIGTLDIDLGFLLPGLKTKIVGSYNFNTFLRKNYMTFQKSYKAIKAQPGVNDYIYGPIDESQTSTFTFSQADENLRYRTRQKAASQFNWFLNYDQQFGKHGVSAMAVFETAQDNYDWVEARAYAPIANIDQFFVYSSDEDNRTGYAEEGNGGRMSWIGRLNYNYADKYIAEFSFRYDGNDKFAKGNRWGFFPAVSAAWRITQESWMEGTKDWLSNLKLRASWGQTGSDKDVSNETIADFTYTQTYGMGSSYLFGDGLANTIAPNAVPNPYVTWATSTNYNVGLDFGFFGNRLTGELDVFYRKEKDVLGSRTVTLPSTYGQSLAAENYAERSWRGGELTLRWTDRTADGAIDYSVYGNLGYADDQWDVLDESAIYREGGALHDLSLVGKSPHRIIGLIADHLLTDPAEVEALKAKGFKQYGRDPYLGGILYKDTRSDGYVAGPDGKIDSNDFYNVLSENAKPRMNYGFGGSIKWKGITLDAHFQGVLAYDRCVGTGSGGFNQYGGANRVYYPIWASDKCYDPERNPNGVYPRVVGSSWYESGTGVTSFWIRNGAYIRLKNLNIAYDLPKNWLRPLGLNSVQVFGNATNLFVISDLTEFIDPEQKHYDSYPLMKTFSFGLNVSF